MDINRTMLIGTALALTILLGACASTNQGQPPAQGSALPGTEWVLVSLHGEAPIAGKAITLRFEEGSVEGSGGCNTYGGSYATSEESLRLSDLYWTEMACMEPEGIMAQEQAYLSALNSAAGYRIENDRLELTDEAGAQVLAFDAASD
jgi:heat shock protein HslJ